EHAPGWADFLRRVQAPAAGRRAQVEHTLPAAQELRLLLDLFELEDAPRRIAALPGLQGARILARVGILLATHADSRPAVGGTVVRLPGLVQRGRPPAAVGTPAPSAQVARAW